MPSTCCRAGSLRHADASLPLLAQGRNLETATHGACGEYFQDLENGGDTTPLPTCPSCVLRGDLEVKAVGDPLICTGNFKSSHFNGREKKVYAKNPCPVFKSAQMKWGSEGTVNYFHPLQPQSGDISSSQRPSPSLHRSAGRSNVTSWPARCQTRKQAPGTALQNRPATCPRKPAAGNNSAPHSPSALTAKGPKTD